MVNTFKEKRKARRDKRKEEGKESIWWEVLDISLDLVELIGPILIRSARSVTKFLDHH
ncbi:hypothetical protein M3610_23865 [Neobacillus sp. MER 74]|uniref:hypothetical protein n=1 Tax=Bacillaceae TaxID=186817 RepID=UPI0015D4D3B5|nr:MULTISPECIES: hypothetical protein [Bacillaceae]MCM3118267.1 hypothetical protein [Neobacillus sp. MER 74]